MNGSIGVESTPGEGSTFWATARFCRQAEEEREHLGLPELKGKRVLVVDDVSSRSNLIGTLVSTWGMRYECASSREEALFVLRQAADEKAPYAVAIIDMEMRGDEGLALARRINGDAQLSKTRLIVLTSPALPPRGENLEELNLTLSCSKPVREASLFDCFLRVASNGFNESRQPDGMVVGAGSSGDERILVAEDNLVNQQVALGNLRKLGYNDADVAANGLEVLEALRNRQYKIILMDCQMPDLDGYEVTKRIRHMETGRHHTWIIAVTAGVMAEDRRKCLEAGMDDYVSKPLTRSQLRSVLEAQPGF